MTSRQKSDKDILSVLGKCHIYAQKRIELSEKLSAGFFQLAMARKNGKLRLSADDVREDFDSHVRIAEDNTENFQLIESERGTSKYDLMMFSALPPPSLHRAQDSFIESLEILISLAITMNKIQKDLK